VSKLTTDSASTAARLGQVLSPDDCVL